MNKLSVYQIYYQDQQKDLINPSSIPYFNENLTVFFENKVILDLFKKDDSEYFGCLSYKFEEKNGVLVPFDYIEKNNFDIYCLGGNSIFQHNVFEFSRDSHGAEWGYLFHKMLLEALCNDDHYIVNDLIENVNTGVYQNAVVARKEVYELYIESMLKPCMNWMVQTKSIQHLINSQCKYGGSHSLEYLKKHIGYEYYTFHTFLLERLWSVFIHVNKDNYSIKFL